MPVVYILEAPDTQSCSKLYISDT